MFEIYQIVFDSDIFIMVFIFLFLKISEFLKIFETKFGVWL